MHTVPEPHASSRTEERRTAPLRHVERVAVSEESGTALNPNYFWLTREYSLTLECGHVQVRARCAFEGSAPEKLNPPLPQRVRCANCPSVPSRGRSRNRKPDPVFDPVVGNLVGAMCKGAPERQDSLLEWVDRYGRYVADEVQRDRAYAAVTLTVIDAYLPDTRNAHAHGVRAAVQRWSEDPTEENRDEIRRASRRLYDAQLRDGDWYAHRGIIEAVKITSPRPHNIQAVLECPTWDNATRSMFYNKLWALRNKHDEARTREEIALREDDGDGVRHHNNVADVLRDELIDACDGDRPVLGEQHVELAASMLSAYQGALNWGRACQADYAAERPA